MTQGMSADMGSGASAATGFLFSPGSADCSCNAASARNWATGGVDGEGHANRV